VKEPENASGSIITKPLEGVNDAITDWFEDSKPIVPFVATAPVDPTLQLGLVFGPRYAK
jgi:hypothetical protein